MARATGSLRSNLTRVQQGGSTPGGEEVDELATPDERENERGHRPEH